MENSKNTRDDKWTKSIAVALPVSIKEKECRMHGTRNGSMSFEMGKEIKKGIKEVWREGWQSISQELFS